MRIIFQPSPEFALHLPNLEAPEPERLTAQKLVNVVGRHVARHLAQKKYKGWTVKVTSPNQGNIHLGKTDKTIQFAISYR